MLPGEKDSRWEPLATSLPTGDVGLEKNTGRDCNDNYLYHRHHLYHRHSSSESLKGEQDLDFTDLWMFFLTALALAAGCSPFYLTD